MPQFFVTSEQRKLIVEHGCFTREKNQQIYDKWFKNSPRYIFRAINNKYHLTDLILCDVGCAYGMNLLYCNKSSYGIEIVPEYVQFAKAIGLSVFQRDVMKDSLDDLPRVQAVWCSALLEHVDSPHLLLRKLYSLLTSHGLLFVYVPTIPPWPFSLLRHISFLHRYFVGYTHSDHVNAFTGKTLRFMCERAGFETIELTPCYPGALSVFNFFHVIDGIVYVGRKIDDWNYSGNSTRITK